MKPRRLLPFTAAITCVLTASAHADWTKANNTTNLNLAGSWVDADTVNIPNPPPGPGDVAVWDSTVTGYNVSALGGDLSWKGIKITDVGGAANPSATTAGIQITNASSANTLTLGTAGIDMSTATQALMIQSKITLANDQIWNIANANTSANPFAGSGVNAGLSEDLLLWAQVTGTAFNLGGKALTLQGAGSIGIISGYTLSNGTLNVNNTGGTWIQSGSSRTTTLLSTLAVNVGSGATLRLRANSGAGGIGINSAAAISVSGTGSKLQLENNNSTNALIQSGNLTFGNGSTLEAIVNQSGAFTISAPTISTSLTAASMTWLVNGSNAGHASGVAVSSNITGDGVIAYQNTASGTNGQIRLSGDNSGFTGTMNLNGVSGNRSLRLTSATAGSALATWAPAAGNILQVDGVAVNLGTLNGAGTVTNSHATNVAKITVGAGAFSGAITNGAPANGMALTKTGSGTFTLSGANTYTGLTDIQGGTLKIGTGGSITSPSISVATGATFDVSDFAPYTLANNLTLSGNGAVSGVVNDSTGTQLLAGGANAVGTLTFNNDLNLSGNGSAAFNFASPISGDKIIVTGTLTPTNITNLLVSSQPTGGFTSAATYNLFEVGNTLNGTVSNFNLVNNTRSSLSLAYSGNNVVMTVDSGVGPQNVVWVGGAGGNVWDIKNTANWDYGDAKYYDDDNVSFTGTGAPNSPVTLNTAVKAGSVTVDSSSGDYVISGTGSITGTTGIAKSGSSALTLATSNTFAGGVQLNAGTLNVNHANALGTGTLTIAGGTTLNNTSGSAKVAANAQNWNGDFTFTGSSDLTLGAAAMNASRQVTVNGSTLTVGAVSGTGFGLTKAGTGALAIGASTYTGATVVNGGVLKATAAAAFNNSSSVTLADVAGAALDLNGFNQTANNLSGGGTTGGNVSLGSGVLTANNSADSTFAGVISGTGGLIKGGNAALTLTGTNTYTGVTTISAGTLKVGTIGNGSVAGNLGNASSAATNLVFDGGTLQYTGSNATSDRAFTINTGKTATIDTANSISFAGATGTATNGALTKIGSGTLTLTGVNTYTGGTTVSAGRLTLVNTKTGSSNFVTNAELEFNLPSAIGVADQQINGGTISGTGNLIKSGTGVLKLGGNASPQTVALTGANSVIDVQGGVLRNEYLNSAWGTNKAGLNVASGAIFDTWDGNTTVDELNGSGTINKGWSSTNTLTIGVNNGSGNFTGVILNNASLGYGGQGGGTLALIKQGTGTQTLSGANTYAGGTTLNQGTLTVGTGGTLGATTGALAVNNNNTTAAGTNTVLNLATAVDTTVGSLSGTISTPTGGTNTATINNGGAGRNFTVNQTAAATYGGVIAGDGAFTLGSSSNNTLTLSGVNTYTGATTINGGTLALGASGSIDNTSGVSLGTNGTFDVSLKSGGYSVSNLSGSGTVKGALSVSTQLAIGNSPGTASFDSGLTLDSAAYIYEMTGGATPGVGSADLANITGTLNITTGSILDLVELGTYTLGNKFTLFGYTTGITGTFDGLLDGAEFNDDLANKWQIDYNDTTAGLNGGIGTSFVTITAVPEPRAALLGGLGLLALLRRRRA